MKWVRAFIGASICIMLSLACSAPVPVPLPVTDTPIPTTTPSPEPTATSTRRPTNTPRPRPSPTRPKPTSTLTPEPTATTAQSAASASRSANRRGGPGTDYPVVGGATAGQALDIVGSNGDRTWYRLADGSWISATLVNNPPPVPTIGNIPARVAQPTRTPSATPLNDPPDLEDMDTECVGRCAEIVILNQTGAPLTYTLLGPTPLAGVVVGGKKTLKVLPGPYIINIGARCGSTSDEFVVTEDAGQELKYWCQPM